MPQWQEAPEQRRVKINCDNDSNPSSRRGRTRILARDSNDHMVEGCHPTCLDTMTINVEACAILQTIDLAIQMKWHDVIIELDCANLIKQIKGLDFDLQCRLENIIATIRLKGTEILSVS